MGGAGFCVVLCAGVDLFCHVMSGSWCVVLCCVLCCVCVCMAELVVCVLVVVVSVCWL